MSRWIRDKTLVYCTKHWCWHKGEERLQNKTSIEVNGDNAEAIAQKILEFLNSENS